MTKHPLKLILAGLVLLAAVGSANAESGLDASYHKPDFRDVVRDSSGNVVRSSSGNCVRTQWLNTFDACDDAGPITREDRTVYFPLNQSGLTGKAKQHLNSLAKAIKAQGASVKGVSVVGYADRLGSKAKNEKLSKSRADTVRKYLVHKGIVSSKSVETRWFGDSMPATDCPKTLKRSKLIACLQKDRRVEVEIDYSN